jgi:hypothetical protein
MRQRRRNGIKVLIIEVANAEQTLDAWIELGLLSETQRNDPKSISVALAVLARAGARSLREGSEMPRRAGQPEQAGG